MANRTDNNDFFLPSPTYLGSRLDIIDQNCSDPYEKYHCVSLGMFLRWGDSSTTAKSGFLTTGHGLTVGSEVYFDGTLIGIVREVVVNSSIDLALIETEGTQHIFMNTTSDGEIYSYVGGIPEIDVIVRVYGCTTSLATGPVCYRNLNGATLGDNTMNGLLVCNMITQAGDSGACAFYPYNGKYSYAGIVVGGGANYTMILKYNTLIDYLRSRYNYVYVGKHW